MSILYTGIEWDQYLLVQCKWRVFMGIISFILHLGPIYSDFLEWFAATKCNKMTIVKEIYIHIFQPYIALFLQQSTKLKQAWSAAFKNSWSSFLLNQCLVLTLIFHSSLTKILGSEANKRIWWSLLLLPALEPTPPTIQPPLLPPLLGPKQERLPNFLGLLGPGKRGYLAFWASRAVAKSA